MISRIHAHRYIQFLTYSPKWGILNYLYWGTMRTNVGARLRAERTARNLSQADMERRTGIPRCRISWLEHGRAVPTIETLEKISDALEIPVYRLLYDGDEVTQTVKASSKIATNGNKGTIRKNESRLLSDLGEYVRRMHRDDQRLLLFIAEKMAGRAQRQPAVPRSQDIGDGLDGSNESGSGG